MWLIFDSLEHKTDLISRKGTTYSAYVLKGTKKGMAEKPDEPYEKILFETTACDVIEKGITRPNCSVIQFFQKAVKPGDTVVMKMVKGSGPNMWNIESLENLRTKIPTYEPLPDTVEAVPVVTPAPSVPDWVK